MQASLPVPQVVELFGCCSPSEEQFQVLGIAADLACHPVVATDGASKGWGAGTMEVLERGEPSSSVSVYSADGSLLMFAVS